VSAIPAKILVIISPALGKPQEMPSQQTHRWMFDSGSAGLLLEKGMAALTRVFVQTVTGCHVMNTMPKQVAQITDLLLEGVLIGVGIALNCKKQRMAALTANILVVSGSFCNPDVLVSEYKT